MNRVFAALLAVVALAAPAVAQAPAQPFRVGYLGVDAPCAAAGPGAPAAYAALLSARLKRPVVLCGFAGGAAAGAALATGAVDLALLDAGGFAPHQGAVRTILTGRAADGPGRVLSVLMARAADPRARAADFAPARVVLGGAGPLMQAGPVQAMADAGVRFTASPQTLAGAEAALAAVRAGGSDAALLDAASVTRNCRANDATSRRCADLKEVWRGRPRPARAWAVRRDMAEALRFQLVGIHIALHQEAPAAAPFALAGMSGAALLEPTEALSLVDASQKVRDW
jgi:ABC-type phosphate/phosphonate transport system substrate-binding protein